MSEAMIWRKQPTNEAENKWTDRWTEGNLGGSWKRFCWITSSVNPVLAEVWFLAGFSFSNFSFGLLFLWPASVLSCPPFFLATCISVVVLVRPVQCVFPPQLRPKKANVAPCSKDPFVRSELWHCVSPIPAASSQSRKDSPLQTLSCVQTCQCNFSPGTSTPAWHERTIELIPLQIKSNWCTNSGVSFLKYETDIWNRPLPTVSCGFFADADCFPDRPPKSQKHSLCSWACGPQYLSNHKGFSCYSVFTCKFTGPKTFDFATRRWCGSNMFT